MKKIFSFIAATVLALGFTGCEDVPIPYGFPNWEDIDDGSADEILKALFTTSLDGFKTICVTGEYPWKVDHSCAQVTSYVDGNNNPADSWLISPEVDLSKKKAAPRRVSDEGPSNDGQEIDTDETTPNAAHIIFDYILRYANAGDLKKNYLVLISSEYSEGENPVQYEWKTLDFQPVLGADWNTWYSSGKLSIPDEFIGKKVHVALRYISTTKAATWEVKNFKVKWGAGDNNQVDPNKLVQLPYKETFASGLGDFRSILVEGTGEWFIDYSTAKATGYDGTNRNPGVFYLVSPIIQLNNDPVQLDYEYILQYFVKKEDQQVLINDHFDEANPAEGWVLLNQDHIYGRVDNSGKVVWSVFDPMSIQIPEKYLGKKVRIAFRYESHNGNCSTWEVRNFHIFNGNEGNVVDNVGDETLPNGDFECWISGQPNNWAPQGYSVAEYERSTIAHSGKYSILLKGSTGASMNFAYKPIDLPAGTYMMGAYFALPDDLINQFTDGSVSPTAKIQFGLINAETGGIYSKALQRGTFTVSYDGQNRFVYFEHAFTLESAMKVCPLIIINKNPGNSVIMDDFVLADITNQTFVRIIY